jgi:non-heme chloroperoxidase
MRERIREKSRGLYISMPGLVTASFLDQIAMAQPLPERQYDLPTKRAQVDGAELHYFEFGEGEPVVFVHGSIGDYRTWGYQFEPFSASYKVISYSRRYHYPNAWTGDGSDYTTGLHTDDLAAFIKSIGLGPAHADFLGQSEGPNRRALEE